MERILMDIGIEEPSEFEYFENMADLLESEADYDEDEIFELLKEVDIEGFGELAENYFDDLLENVPDRETDAYMLLDGLKNAFLYLASHDDENLRNRRKLAETVAAFRDWFSKENSVRIDMPHEGGKLETKYMSVMDALSTHRLARIDKSEGIRYDFGEALSFDFGGYDLDIAELLAAADEDAENEDGGEI